MVTEPGLSDEQRLEYLRLLGIQTWVPRVELPGALQEPEDFIREPESEAPSLASPSPAAISVELPVVKEIPVEPNFVDQVLPPAAQTLPKEEGVTVKDRREPPRFRFTSLYFPGECLLISDMPLTAETMLNVQQINLIQGLMSAIGISNNRVPTPVFFDWPLLQNQQVAQSHCEAVAAVQAFLAAQTVGLPLRFVLIMGDTASRYILPDEAELTDAQGKLWSVMEFPALMTESVGRMLEEPLCKREVWRHIQPLRRLYANRSA